MASPWETDSPASPAISGGGSPWERDSPATAAAAPALKPQRTWAEAGKTAGSHLLSAVTDIPHEIYEAGKSALTTMNDTLNPWSDAAKAKMQSQMEATRKGFFPGLKESVSSGLDVGRGAVAPLALAASPITGTGRSVLGHALAAPGQITYEQGKEQADLALSAIRPSRVPTPPPPAPRVPARLERAITRDSDTPQELASRLQQARQIRPEATVADVGGENVRGLVEDIAQRPGQGRSVVVPALSERQQGQMGRILNDLRGLTGTRQSALEATNETMAARAQSATPLYETAYNEGDRAVWSPGLERLSGAPSVRSAMAGAVRIWQDNVIADGYGAMNPSVVDRGGQLTFGRSVPVFPNLQFWDYTKRLLDDRIRVAIRSGQNAKARTLTNLVSTLRGELDTQVPSYAAARNSWGGPAQYLDAIEEGRGIFNAPSEELAQRFAQMSAAEQEGYRIGALSEVNRRLGRNTAKMADYTNLLRSDEMRRNILTIMPTPEAALAWHQRLNHEVRSSELTRTALGNSATARRQALKEDAENFVADMAMDVVTHGASGGLARRILMAFPSRIRERIRGRTDANLANLLTRPGQSIPLPPATPLLPSPSGRMLALPGATYSSDVQRARGGRLIYRDEGGLIPNSDLDPVFQDTPSMEAVRPGEPLRMTVRPRSEALPMTVGAAPGAVWEMGKTVGAGAQRAANYLAPNIFSLATGEESVPVDPYTPNEAGKLPLESDRRWLSGLGEAAELGVGLVGPPMKAAAPIIGAGIARLAPDVASGALSMTKYAPVKSAPFAWTGAAPITMHNVAPHDFHSVIGAAKEAHPSGAAVTLYSPEEYAAMRTFSAPDGSAGFALNGDDIVSVFRHPNSKYTNSAASMLSTAVQAGGKRLDAFDTVLPHIYGRNGFRAVARVKFDPQFAPEGWSYDAFKQFNGGKPDVVFMVHDPYNPGYHPGDGALVGSYDEAVALQKQAAGEIAKRVDAGKAAFENAASKVTGLKRIGEFLTPEELEGVTTRSARSLVDLFGQMPTGEEMAAVAYAGRAKRGWYKNSARAIVDMFGTEDAPRFTALLAALSPQSSVESNLENALRVWTEWKRAGSPKEASEIVAAMGRSVLGDKGEKSVLDAWRGNAIRALQAEDPRKLTISGPKVNSFAQNLRDNVHEVTNDTWMANYAGLPGSSFRGRYIETEGGEKVGVKSAGYLSMSAATRRAAKVLSEKTGEVWTPAEIQETVWSWARTLANKAGEDDAKIAKILKAGDLTHKEIANTPDFALLFAGNVYRKILEQGGYDVKRLLNASGPRSGQGASGTPFSVEGTKFAQSAFERHLKMAGKRLKSSARQQGLEEAE